jgi:DNA-binding response OmpR family regulator
MHILLVEDNRRLSESLKITLEEDGYAVDTAYDGLDGEEMGLISSYDIIILDIMLPGKDGMEVCRELRKRRGMHWMTGCKDWTVERTITW